MPQIDGNSSFWPLSWSPDGKRLVGIMTRTDGTNVGAAVFDIAAKQFSVFPASALMWTSSVWMPDSERFLTRDDTAISIVNARTKAAKPLISVGGYAVGRSVGVTADGRTITYTETGTEGEIWLATFSPKK